jgi:hypothetical protein
MSQRRIGAVAQRLGGPSAGVSGTPPAPYTVPVGGIDGRGSGPAAGWCVGIRS